MLNLLRILKKLLALGNEVSDNSPLGLQLIQRLLLSLNQLFDVLNTAGSNITSGAEHDSIQELNMRLQFITIGIALPVQIHLDLSFEDSWDQVLMFLNDGIQFGTLFSAFLFSSLSHQNFQDLLQPFLDLSALKIFAEGLKFEIITSYGNRTRDFENLT